MRQIFSLLLIALCATNMGLAQNSGARKSVAVLGDSYSTFERFVSPDTNLVWYYAKVDTSRTDVASAAQTWWNLFAKENGLLMGRNNSYSGATISYTGYNGKDFKDRSFITRDPDLGTPDIIVVFGGTNDSWAKVPMGDYKYSDIAEEDLYQFRPAMAYLVDDLSVRYPNTEIIYLLNDGLEEGVPESMRTVCQHYGVPLLELKGIAKKNGHPTREGMRSIADQLTEFYRSLQSVR